FHQGSGVATPFHEAGYTDAVVHRFEIKTNTGKPGGVHIRITARGYPPPGFGVSADNADGIIRPTPGGGIA
ncbi:hypothetical protein ACSEQM_20100, partial [Pseudomonas aeruginosa]